MEQQFEVIKADVHNELLRINIEFFNEKIEMMKINHQLQIDMLNKTITLQDKLIMSLLTKIK
jgi:hypothetical protein